MDLNSLTISPDLFYSKTSNELWKPRSLQKVTPVQITKTMKKTKASRFIPRRSGHKKSKSKTTSPQLGRLGKLKRFRLKKLTKKKLILGKSTKTAAANKENKDISNEIQAAKPMTIQQQKIMTKTVQRQEEEISKKRYFQPPKSITPKRAKGSSYKLFKSKNVREETDSSSESEDDLVPEIRDFSDPSGTSVRQPSPPSKPSASILIDPLPFEDEEVEHELVSTNVIESLLQNLDGEEEENSPEATKASEVSSLDSLIDTLQGNTVEKSTETVKPKTKFMGLGKNQMQIDAGQKKFGLVDCKECGFSYNVSESRDFCKNKTKILKFQTNVPEDEKIHNKHHLAVTTVPRFRGWTNEDAVAVKEWTELNGRIIHLSPGSKKIDSDYVMEIIGKMEMDFGAQDLYDGVHVYLAVLDSKMVGLATLRESVKATKISKDETVRLGVQRLYVRPEFRRKGIAKALLKTIPVMHNKGELLELASDVAFSTPTEEGKKLIENIIGSQDFFTFSS